MNDIAAAEEKREEAERLREEHEVKRRIAEGGPDQHVPGNTKPGRVEAEQTRQAERRRMYRRVAALIALPIALISLLPSTVGLVLLKREVDHRCRDGQVNRQAIRDTLLRSFDALGYAYNEKTGQVTPNGRAIQYYLDHPEDRERQKQSAIATIERFPPITCNDSIL